MAGSFTPAGATVSLAVSTTTGRVAAPFTTTRVGSQNGGVRLYNAGSSTVFVEFGDGTVTAAVASSFPLPAGGIEVFDIGGGVSNVAAITASGTATLYITPGFGN